ncbi:MAG TPA: ABC transporter substrate-binding protein [Gemmatimonadaceae bacterium]|nr:ABC transporter substrate-binding protein [Gemmatimonadaceae bacterium]
MRKPVLVLAAALMACSGGSSGSAVKFGAAGPWSDPGYGAMNQRGIQLAYEQIKASPAFKDHPFDIDFRDDKASGEQATDIAKSFVADPSVVAVIGHVNSGTEVAAAQVYDAGHLVSMATTASSPALTGVSPWVFRVISSDSVNGMDIARFASTTLNRRRAAILYENNAYGRGLAEAFRRNFSGAVIEMDPIAEGAQDFEPYVSYLKARNPDLIFVPGEDGSGRPFVAEVRRQKLSAALLGGDGWTGLTVDTANAEGVYVGAPFTAENPDPDVQKFVAAFKAKFGRTPDGNAALAYDATNLLFYALTRVGPDRAKIRDFLAHMDEQSAWAGVTGHIRFGTNGDPAGKSIVMTVIHNGALKVAGDK